MVYLFLGQDSLSKDIQLKRIRQATLSKETEQFNLDILYAKELTLKELQERLSFLPAKGTKRIVVLKGCEYLRKDLQDFLLQYAKNPYKQIILILDTDYQDKISEFINRLLRYVKTLRFKETKPPDVFTLSRFVTEGRPEYALRVLNQLLKDGEKPERILGGLRYSCEREASNVFEMHKRLKLLLACDMEIKTGRIKPHFALEKLVISLCGFGKPFC